MQNNKIILVGGGTRSGKSAFALSLAKLLGPRRLYLATAEIGDDEMRQRIARHRDERGAEFTTVEEPLAVCDAFKRHPEFDVVVLDCLTLWLSNLLLEGGTEKDILSRVDDLAALMEKRTWHAIIVTNEVGLGIVPETPLGRAFRDVAGWAHQKLSRVADEVYFAVLGTVLKIKA